MEAQKPAAEFYIQHKALPYLPGSQKSCGEELGQTEESVWGVGWDTTVIAPYVFSVSKSKTSKDILTNKWAYHCYVTISKCSQWVLCGIMVPWPIYSLLAGNFLGSPFTDMLTVRVSLLQMGCAQWRTCLGLFIQLGNRWFSAFDSRLLKPEALDGVRN